MTPLEHKQIQIKANQDVLFEQAGGVQDLHAVRPRRRLLAGGVKRTGGGDDGFSDMGSEDDEKAAAKSKKKPLTKKSKKSHDSGEKDDTVRAEGLSYKVCQSQSLRAVRMY